jgi:hypothetical protein
MCHLCETGVTEFYRCFDTGQPHNVCGANVEAINARSRAESVAYHNTLGAGEPHTKSVGKPIPREPQYL